MFNSNLKKRVLELEQELKRLKAMNSSLAGTVHLQCEELQDVKAILAVQDFDIAELQEDHAPKNMTLLERYRALKVLTGY